jgi:hypothetical protein
MNLQIQPVIADLTGVTGLAIIDAILEGERDPAQSAKLRNPRIQARPENHPEIAGGTLATPTSISFEAVPAAVLRIPAADCRMRRRDRTAGRRFSSAGRSAGKAPAGGQREEP